MMICFDVFFPLSTTGYGLALCASHKIYNKKLVQPGGIPSYTVQAWLLS